MARNSRDEFAEGTKRRIAKQASWLCSYPSCRIFTVGSNSDGDDVINVGTACHICAAAPGGPRYDPSMTPEQRKSPDNGIWMCRNHGTAVDAKDSSFTVKILHEWKAEAQQESWRRVVEGDAPLSLGEQTPSDAELRERLHVAAAADLEVYRRSDNWPSVAIELTAEVHGLDGAIGTSALATALTTLDDLVLVAPPGVGKTTTLIQIAESALSGRIASPILVPLGEWSVSDTSLVDSILSRPAFREISEGDLRSVAAKPGVLLLLDGWNELDGLARDRARAQITRLQLELPELNLLVSTRRQSLDVPFRGTRIELLPLDGAQQLQIARGHKGDTGEHLLDQAWRVDGLRELVTIPLYLSALLSLPEDAQFPTTKEEVLRRFVNVHEDDDAHAAALARVTLGLHSRFLEGLAETATRCSTTSLAESVARKSIFETDDTLVAEGQITDRPQPQAVLEALVSHHVLIRGSGTGTYSFQHQQFQEWYASLAVERLIRVSADDESARALLKAEMLNLPAWEEAVLFACERLSRGDVNEQDAAASAVLEALTVDPFLAAEMVCRSTDAVWSRVEGEIRKLVERWHTPGEIDRALRFMVNSGRSEFLDLVWPLFTHDEEDVQLRALRVGRRIPSSLLGSDAAERIAALQSRVRRELVYELALKGDFAGMELAASIATSDSDLEVKTAAVNAFSFRGADRHMTEVLLSASDATFDLVVRKVSFYGGTSETVKTGLAAARERWRDAIQDPGERLNWLVQERECGDCHSEVVTLIAELEIDSRERRNVDLVHQASRRFPAPVAEGLLQRVRQDRALPYYAPELLATSGLELEEDDLVDIALGGGRNSTRAESAASVLGPRGVSRLLDTYFSVKKLTRDDNGRFDETASDRYFSIQDRLRHSQVSNLLTAIGERASTASSAELAGMADLISRRSEDAAQEGKGFGAVDLEAASNFAEDWAARLLHSSDATRAQLASIATLVSRVPNVKLLPQLKQLLDRDLSEWRAFNEQARAVHFRGGDATNEARMSWTLQYRRAFDAIRGPETTALVCEYLPDMDFGVDAALLLAGRWRAENEPSDGSRFRMSPDFSRVTEKRSEISIAPTRSSAEAEAIFGAIEQVLAEEPSGKMKQHAVALAAVAVALPHGERGEIIDEIVAFADRCPRARLLNNLVLSGKIVDVDLVTQGIDDVFEAAEEAQWILTDRNELGEWLRLLPFSNRPSEALRAVQALPEQYRAPNSLKEMVVAFGFAADDEAESTLFALAESDQRLYAHSSWRDAVTRRGTLSSAIRLVELAAQGTFNANSNADQEGMVTRIARLIGEQAELRGHIYSLLNSGGEVPGTRLLLQAVASNPDAEGVLVLVRFEIDGWRELASWGVLMHVVAQSVPSVSWKGAYEVHSLPAAELRRELMAMTTDGGPNDAAARCLRLIDRIRDDYGTPESEPRHPDLGSGIAWPMISVDSDSEDSN